MTLISWAGQNLRDIQHRVRELWRIARELERTIANCAGGTNGQCSYLAPYATSSRGDQHVTARKRRSVS